MTTIVSWKQPRPGPRAIPPLRDGERLSQPEFHRRYLAAPEGVKADLVEGTVYMAPSVGSRHGRFHVRLAGLFFLYESATPGVEAADNTTVVLGPESEPQPDLHLRLTTAKGRSRVQEGLVTGPPELAAEVSDSTRALDLNAKRRDYDRAGILEYLVLMVQEGSLRAFAPGATELPVDADGVYRSKVFPDLWIDAAAIVAGDLRRAIRVLNKGLKSPEHAAFVKRLKATAKASAPPKARVRRRT